MEQRHPLSRRKTAPRWRGREGYRFVVLIDSIRYADCDARAGKPLPWKHVLRELRKHGHRDHRDEAKLKADFHNARKFWSVLGDRAELPDPNTFDELTWKYLETFVRVFQGRKKLRR